MKTRFFVIASCLTLLVCMLAVPAFAAENEYTVTGRWQFNDELTPCTGGNFGILDYNKQLVTFTTNGETFVNMTLYRPDADALLSYSKYTNLTGNVVCSDSNTWSNEAYKTVDFGREPQVVSEWYYEWLEANATWLDKPSAIQLLMNDIGALFTAAIGFVGVVATTVTGNPILLLFALLSLVGLGIGLFVRMKNIGR